MHASPDAQFYSAGVQILGFENVRKGLYELNYIPSSKI